MPAGRVGRLTSTATFAALQRSRRRGASGPVRAVFVPEPVAPVHPGSGPPSAHPGKAPNESAGTIPQVRVGYAVSKRCGSAVERNTLRRRMREVARDAAPSLPTGSYLLRLSAEAGSLERARFRADVAEALRRAGAARSAPPSRTASTPSDPEASK